MSCSWSSSSSSESSRSELICSSPGKIPNSFACGRAVGPGGRTGFESTGPAEEDAGRGRVDLAGEESPMEEVAESESSSESD